MIFHDADDDHDDGNEWKYLEGMASFLLVVINQGRKLHHFSCALQCSAVWLTLLRSITMSPWFFFNIEMFFGSGEYFSCKYFVALPQWKCWKNGDFLCLWWIPFKWILFWYILCCFSSIMMLEKWRCPLALVNSHLPDLAGTLPWTPTPKVQMWGEDR